MPDDVLISLAVVAFFEACSLPAFCRRVAAGLLPAPFRIGRSNRVRVGDYRRMLATRREVRHKLWVLLSTIRGPQRHLPARTALRRGQQQTRRRNLWSTALS